MSHLADKSIQAPPGIVVGFACSPDERDSLLKSRAGAHAIHSELVEASAVRKPAAYRRFWKLDSKKLYREQLVRCLVASWQKTHGEEKAEPARQLFVRLTSEIEKNGAVVFASLIDRSRFRRLVDEYTRINQSQGSRSWIHSYVNLGNNMDFLGNPEFSGAFMHPLLVALVSYQVGGPIRIVDARGKDAEPLSVLAQDNTLHIDNTPFNDEYKVILTWERGTTSGPKGQNFVILPGTHHGLRNCFVNSRGEAWSTENASIFVSEEAIQQALNIQRTALGRESAAVVEIRHHDKPLTTVFASGSLVHHRYRTEGGLPRSCLTVAFRGVDNPGPVVDTRHLSDAVQDHALNRFLFGIYDRLTSEDFIEALAGQAEEIFHKLADLSEQRDGAEILDQGLLELSEQEIGAWKSTCTRAPTVAELKTRADLFKVKDRLPHREFVERIEKLMIFDKHGPLDLILYEDSHEEIRKWSRNLIREMKFDSLKLRLKEWAPAIRQPTRDDLLEPAQIRALAEEVANHSLLSMTSGAKAHLGRNEKISAHDAYRSVWQLLLDLGEAIVRCESGQDFLSTSLFIFWATDALDVLQGQSQKRLKDVGSMLLANYIASAVLVEMHRQDLSSKEVRA